MTDSISITLDLSFLPRSVRRQVPQLKSMVTDQWGEMQSRYFVPVKRFSPLSGTKTKWIVRYDQIPLGEGRAMFLPSSVDADLNLPNALKGQNLEHGTSVFAAGVASLWLLKIWLAEAGIDRYHLNALTPAAVSLRGVTLTYLLRMLSVAEAQELVQDLCVTGHILNGRAESYKSTNETLNLPHAAGGLAAYRKTLLKYCKWLAGAPVAEHVATNELLVRLESKLNRGFLAKAGLDTLEAWRHAYSDGLYETLFNKTVLGPLRLDLRHNRPRPEALNRLTATERLFLEDYLQGGDPRAFPSVVASVYPADTYAKLRRSVLKKCRIDTNIPWVEHVQLRCFKLKNHLVYPGDYHPAPELAPWCFCRQSWPELLAELSGCYESAVARAAAANRTTDTETV